MTSVPIYSADGSSAGKVELPKVFAEDVRDELIKRAVLSEESEEFQPKGTFYRAGLQTSARYVGRKEAYHSLKNRGGAMLPRELYPKGRIGRVRVVPWAVKGRRAHPPKVAKVLVERINKREKQKALRSAIAATSRKEIVSKKHIFADVTIPLIVDEKCEGMKKTKDVFALFEKMKISKDIERAMNGRKARTGHRYGGTKTPWSVLVVSATAVPLLKAARNIPGVTVSTVDKLQVRDLAPGGVPGRLTIWTKAALEALK
jgi:large subunit ribosomal protein L4e